MEFNKQVKITLTEMELKDLIAEYIGKKVNKTIHPENITFDVRTKIEGYGLGEYSEEYLQGCTVVYQEN